MKAPILAVLSLAIPATVGAVGYLLARSVKGASNMGEALGPYFAFALTLIIAVVVGETAAVASLIRGERLRWLAWLGALIDAALIMPVIYLLVTADWN